MALTKDLHERSIRIPDRSQVVDFDRPVRTVPAGQLAKRRVTADTWTVSNVLHLLYQQQRHYDSNTDFHCHRPAKTQCR